MLPDIAGLVAAHDAYLKLSPTKRHQSFHGFPYKDEQLFFIAYCVRSCDNTPNRLVPGYAPRRDRCQVPLRMVGAFGEAFRCPAGSPMWIYNESRRCTFW
ncbi:hypothetical protein HPB48_011620 [Haemaphysalis longicornis]|uniref:Peptidase M13 C-terminal domain-containing protein n=1 Tax=Haemaphysalis longicornis TaxID=44386 RepID=A0A9J6FYV5_HAELO|nr:hypothetical protein HPB48_011620 [Haemaphysalis longicornis]